jgi:hypothetical protein
MPSPGAIHDAHVLLVDAILVVKKLIRDIRYHVISFADVSQAREWRAIKRKSREDSDDSAYGAHQAPALTPPRNSHGRSSQRVAKRTAVRAVLEEEDEEEEEEE